MKLPWNPAELLRATGILNSHFPPDPDDDPDDEKNKTKRYYCKSVSISDLHIGGPDFRAVECLEMLKEVRSEQLIIAGDFVDFLMLYWHRYFPQSHLTVIQKLLKKARKGTEIIYVPGNHDRRLRKLAAEALHDGDIFCVGENVVCVPLHILTTGRGERFLVLHGDEFDGKSGFSPFWETLGSKGFDFTKWLERRFNVVFRLAGLKEHQFAAWCKTMVKDLIRKYSQNFAKAVASLAEAYGVDGIIYGHIHTPGDDTINGVRVINLGAWVDAPPAGCTLLVEDMDGILALAQWKNGKLYHFATGKEIPRGEICFADPGLAPKVSAPGMSAEVAAS